MVVVVVGVSHTTSLRNSCLTVNLFFFKHRLRTGVRKYQSSAATLTTLTMGANELAVGQVSTAHRRIREGEKPAGGHHANRR